MRFSLRKKLLSFSIIVAIIPLGIAGYTMIGITQDELKSAANDELSNTATELAKEIDGLFLDTWRAPLLLIRDAIDNENLGVDEKIALLTSIKGVTDIVSIQLTVLGTDSPILFAQDEIKQKLQSASLDPTNTLIVPENKIESLVSSDRTFVGDLEYIPQADLWLITIIVKLNFPILGRPAFLSARVNLERLKKRFEEHPFVNSKGILTLIDENGRKIFDPKRTDLNNLKVVQSAVKFLQAGSRAIGVEPYTRPTGEAMLGAYSFPLYFPWAIITERYESDAYLAVTMMFKNLFFWVVVGLILASVGAVYSATRISRPILEVGKVAQEVGKGRFDIRVQELSSNDEISDLGHRINEMINGLRERFELQKFVSSETISAIKKAESGITLGGERKTATVFFSDIRGFTSFSEKVEPEVVIDMLNTYLRHQAHIVRKFHGDIDKFVGDEVVAVFRGNNMVVNAILCSLEIHEKVRLLNQEHPQWDIAIGIGINTGEMIMGAMGSEDRMDYTILGDNVNLGARLCSNAAPYQTLLSENSYNYVKDLDWLEIEKLEPLKVKGKVLPIQIYGVKGVKPGFEQKIKEFLN